jgi:hypothetical protein
MTLEYYSGQARASSVKYGKSFMGRRRRRKVLEGMAIKNINPPEVFFWHWKYNGCRLVNVIARLNILT